MAQQWVGSTQDGKSVYRNDDGSFTYGSDATGWTTGSEVPGGISGASQSQNPAAAPGYTATEPLPGYATTDYAGSYDEWYESTVRAMIDNYLAGVGQTSGFTDPALGAPNEGDFGSGKDGKGGTVSVQTERFFENYVRMYGATDPWITQHFGPPPGRRATYATDPNSDAGILKSTQDFTRSENALDRAFEGEQSALDRQNALDLAKMQQDTALAGFANDWKIASMEDATRRYVAEGDWGTQKYIAEMQEKGQMDRLILELGFRREELGQRALEAKQQHHEAMVALTLEVAKYDAELGAQPRNWLKYAAWLKDRGEVINGLNLATAATMIPENAIDPGEVASTVSSAGGAFGLAQEVQTGQYTVNGIDLNSTDYSGMANQLLGVNSMNPQGPPTTQELQAVSDSLRTTPPGEPVVGAAVAQGSENAAQSIQQQSAAFAQPLNAMDQGRVGFRAYGGPTQNSLGMNIQPSGQKEIYSRFKRLLPSQQEMRMGEVESIGRYAPDFIEELERSRPKGRAQGAAAYG